MPVETIRRPHSSSYLDCCSIKARASSTIFWPLRPAASISAIQSVITAFPTLFQRVNSSPSIVTIVLPLSIATLAGRRICIDHHLTGPCSSFRSRIIVDHSAAIPSAGFHIWPDSSQRQRSTYTAPCHRQIRYVSGSVPQLSMHLSLPAGNHRGFNDTAAECLRYYGNGGSPIGVAPAFLIKALITLVGPRTRLPSISSSERTPSPLAWDQARTMHMQSNYLNGRKVIPTV